MPYTMRSYAGRRAGCGVTGRDVRDASNSAMADSGIRQRGFLASLFSAMFIAEICPARIQRITLASLTPRRSAYSLGVMVLDTILLRYVTIGVYRVETARIYCHTRRV